MPAIETSQFGLLDYQERDVYQFPQGLPGFDREQEFVLVQRSDLSPLSILQSVHSPNLRFVCAPPNLIDPNWHTPELKPGPVRPLVILTFPQQGIPTANMRAPIFLNTVTRQGCQVILTESQHAFEHPLRSASEGAAVCS